MSAALAGEADTLAAASDGLSFRPSPTISTLRPDADQCLDGRDLLHRRALCLPVTRCRVRRRSAPRRRRGRRTGDARRGQGRRSRSSVAAASARSVSAKRKRTGAWPGRDSHSSGPAASRIAVPPRTPGCPAGRRPPATPCPGCSTTSSATATGPDAATSERASGWRLPAASDAATRNAAWSKPDPSPAPSRARSACRSCRIQPYLHPPGAPARSATSAARRRGTAARWRSPAPPARRAPARRGR